MKAVFSVEYLADNLKCIDACAAWDFGFWDVHKKGADLQGAYKALKDSARKGELPLSVVALDGRSGLPIGMASLRGAAGREWAKLSPWIMSVYVHERFRGRGIARALVARMEDEARALGYDAVHLQADDAAGMYEALGYAEIDRGQSIVFKKDLV